MPVQQTLPNIHYPAEDPAQEISSTDGEIHRIEQQAPPPEPVKLVLVDMADFVLECTIRMTTPFERLMREHASGRQLKVRDCRFTFDGERIQPEKTPADVSRERFA